MKKSIKFSTMIILLILSVSLLSCSKTTAESKQYADVLSTDVTTPNINKVLYTDKDSFHKGESFTNELSDGKLWCALAMTDDGIMYGYTNIYNGDKTDLISYNTNTKEYEILSTRDNSFSPITFKHTDKYLFWSEGFDAFDPHTRFVLYDLENKTEKIIDDNEVAYSVGNMAINNEMLLWTEYKVKGDVQIPIIKKYDLKTNECSIFKRNAKNPVIGNDFIAYLADDTVNKNRLGLYVQKFDSNEATQYAFNYDIYEINGYGDSIVLAYEKSAD